MSDVEVGFIKSEPEEANPDVKLEPINGECKSELEHASLRPQLYFNIKDANVKKAAVKIEPEPYEGVEYEYYGDVRTENELIKDEEFFGAERSKNERSTDCSSESVGDLFEDTNKPAAAECRLTSEYVKGESGEGAAADDGEAASSPLRFTCPVCIKGFPFKSGLDIHMQCHASEKPFQCHLCEKTFAFKHSLPAHMLLHSQENPFRCDVCRKGFTQRGNLRRHRATHDKRLYECDVCRKRFLQESSFERHRCSGDSLRSFHSLIAREFYRDVVATEQTATAFLQRHRLLQTTAEAEPCARCGTPMAMKRKRDRGGEFRPVFRCTKKGCQTSRSVRKGNRFFHFTSINNKMRCNLTLCQILEIMYYFIMETGIEATGAFTGRSSHTLVEWFGMCREVCSVVVSVRRRGQLRGTADDPVLIDESRFVGRRKTENDGGRADEPWVFGLSTKSEVRYFVVERRDQDTLIPIIEREVGAGSVVHSGEEPAYRRLQQLDYRHSVVDRRSGYRRELIERRWLEAKAQIMKKMRGVSLSQLQGHLDYVAWKTLRRDRPDKFIAFLEDVRSVYV